ncbi:hypothetical protein [Alkalimarinus alittae]|uniref:Uncharacterized protein n=1 Tax=Alkalimarinus alittae TaxID=2961619 RepID=A0ABY6N1W3_9ALTE|nr:hypothetical protein [Alkalimarinus alittae]UZE96103.1 hypothetical protein NKI27_18970 [Alkalimarinus alittae]
MKQVTIASTIQEFMSFIELMDDAYWEAATLESKDLLYDIISIFSLEISELNKLSIQDHHYPYEIITEGIRRVIPKIERLDEKKEDVIQRTQTLIDIKEVMSNVLSILEAQTGGS